MPIRFGVNVDIFGCSFFGTPYSTCKYSLHSRLKSRGSAEIGVGGVRKGMRDGGSCNHQKGMREGVTRRVTPCANCKYPVVHGGLRTSAFERFLSTHPISN